MSVLFDNQIQECGPAVGIAAAKIQTGPSYHELSSFGCVVDIAGTVGKIGMDQDKEQLMLSMVD